MAASTDESPVRNSWTMRLLVGAGLLGAVVLLWAFQSESAPSRGPGRFADGIPRATPDHGTAPPQDPPPPSPVVAPPFTAPEPEPPPDTSPARPARSLRFDDERVVLHTVAGDVVLAFAPDGAPQNVASFLKLARLGAYDSTQFGRHVPGEFLQLFTLYHREVPFYDRQVRFLGGFPLEKSKLRHVRGAIQITHPSDAPDGGEGSFCIVLGDRPDLDPYYTIVGQVEAGMDVVERLTQLPLIADNNPAVRLGVIKAEVVPASLLPLLRLTPPQPLAALLDHQWPPAPTDSPELLAELTTQAPKILREHCAQCHGAGKIEGGLDVTTAAGLRRGGVHGRVVFAGNALGSPLYARVVDDDQMHKTVTIPELRPSYGDILHAWIDRGAPWPGEATPLARHPEERMSAEDADFWSFQPLKTEKPPAVRDSAWPRTPIDRFILAGLEARKLAPNPAADRRTLARRLWFDLTGLPPEPAELEAFLADRAPDAYEKLVDRLLASPRYGERWGRHWLDLARYADSGGYEDDTNRPTAYWYRDFVVRALNDDLPFDDFLRWQVAGDELAPNDRWAVAATGFATAGPNQDFRPRIHDRYDELDDVVGTIGTAMLGMTVGCARCHDHKYDPIPQADYYRLAAVFAGTRREDRYLPTADGVRLSEAIRPLTQRAVELEKRLAANLRDGAAARERDRIRTALTKQIEGWPQALALAGSGPSSRGMFLERGDDRKECDVVPPGFLTAATPGRPVWKTDTWTAWAPLPRTALANWLTDVDRGAGGLAARVIVNRLWQHHMGEGLVATPNDFGKRGARPSHPALLDWLARDLIAHGWKLKRLHRLIATSAVYQQDVSADPVKLQADPDNRLFGRRRPQRLTSDALRDAVLAVSGNLNGQMYGPSIKPPIPREAILPTAEKLGVVWPADAVDGPVNWRRSVYIAGKRCNPMPFLQTFDSPDASQGCAVRSRTTVPTQALLLMNDPIVRAQAQRFAERLRAAAGNERREQVRLAYLLALARPPSSSEAEKVGRFLDSAGADEAEIQRALQDFCQVLFQTNEFLYVD